MTRRRLAAISLPVLFVLSGAASLVYEVVWMRILGVAVGTEAMSVALVLAAFMGGLAIGAALGAFVVGRLGAASALLGYGALEVSLGLLALAVPALIGGLRALPEGLDVVLGCALLWVPTIAMGATFPLACAALAGLRDETRRGGVGSGRGSGGGDVSALLYGINTLGAVLGTLAAAFLLLPGLGGAASNATAASVSIATGVLALVLSALAKARGGSPGEAAAERAPRVEKPAPAARVERTPRGPLVAAFLAGLAGLTQEIVATRVLSMVMGGTVHAFAVMLAAFLSGIALGSLAFRAVGRRVDARVPLVLAAVLALVTGHLAPELQWWFVSLYRSVGASRALEAVLSGAMLVGPALGLGAAFAGLLREAGGERDGRTAGRLYAANTVGAVVGSLGAGLFLLPVIGLSFTLLLAVAALFLAAAAVRPRPASVLAASAAALACALPGVRPAFPPNQLAMGAFGYVADLPANVDRAAFRRALAQDDVVFHADGRTSTVTVERVDNVNTVYLKTNGKVEGTAPIRPGEPSRADMATQVTLAVAPAVIGPEPRRILVIGLGGGVTIGAALALPVERVDLVEIESAVVEAVRSTEELARSSGRAFDDPRLAVRIADARRVLERAAPSRFDVIVSQPSEPWRAGSANLFTEEMFRAVRRALAPGGRFCQWVQLYGLDEEGLRGVLTTFLAVFPEACALRPRDAQQLLLVGGLEPLRADLGEAGRRLAVPAVRSVLERASLWPPRVVLGQFVADAERLREFARGGVTSTDDLNEIEFRAAGTRFVDPRAWQRLFRDLVKGSPPPEAVFPGADTAEARRDLARGALAALNVWTAEAWAKTLPPPGEARDADGAALFRDVGRAMLHLGDADGAVENFREALRRDPGDESLERELNQLEGRTSRGREPAAPR